MDDDMRHEVVLLQVMHLNDKSNLYFWGTVLVTIVAIASIVAAFNWGLHFLFLAAACWVIARLILIPKGIALNKEAQRLLRSIQD